MSLSRRNRRRGTEVEKATGDSPSTQGSGVTREKGMSCSGRDIANGEECNGISMLKDNLSAAAGSA